METAFSALESIINEDDWLLNKWLDYNLNLNYTFLLKIVNKNLITLISKIRNLLALYC
jgi:hypothetical protein